MGIWLILMDDKKSGRLPTKEWSAKSWHRRASKPIIYWMALFIVLGSVHIIIPNYRWVLIHMFTLGIVTNSIVVWSQHLTEKFTQSKLPDSTRPGQLHRIWVLNGGVVIAVIGQILHEAWDKHWILTQLGATVIAVVVGWHGVSLLRQWRALDADKRFRNVVLGYVVSALCLPLGAILGALLAMGLDAPWHERLLLAHIALNVLGFVGIAAAASLTILFPAIWRTRGGSNRFSLTLGLQAFGLVMATGGALADVGAVAGVGVIVYAAGWVASWQLWLQFTGAVLKDPRDRINYPSVSVLLAITWLTLALVHFGVRLILARDGLATVELPTLPLLVGFAAQLLIGVMSYLLPTTMGGGPQALRAGMKEMNRAGLYRATLINGGLLIWLTTTYSWLAVTASMLCLAALAVFPILIKRSVSAQKAVLLGEAAGPAKDDAASPPWGQVTAGVATLALLLALFGGLGGPS